MNVHKYLYHTIESDLHHVAGSDNHYVAGIIPQMLLILPFILVFMMYILAAVLSSHRHKRWPLHRTVCWTLGVLFAVIAVFGPLANRAHMDFTAHMLGHLLLGMLAPLLMVIAAPMTLVLRTLSIPSARRLSRVLKSWPSRWFTHPIVASFLNIGGLWILYTTDLYSLMHESILFHLMVHFHVFAAGYLFTMSMIYIDPISHRIPYLYRSIVFVIALAGHGILSKYIYAHPPTGIPLEQAELGGMIMYYGGDAIDIVMIVILCWQWFRTSRPRMGLASV